ncbi:hypothetical protein D3875_20025 [Deinococcus cavernae]|uniref:Uncharacterized protein n=1 Tax=Deinococcus cavernae TaxID=2320857 RepID=A0A418VBW4_9DEIO|nr:hypothetical protein [Deinococcus cavernae]RJF73492.1 hypothetical protein D3875_20025 [Deinococcus cavernae]
MTSELLLLEGDRLSRRLMQLLPVTLEDQERVILLGRSLAVNLVNALLPTIEQVSRRQDTPLHTLLESDREGNAVIEIVNFDGELLSRLPVRDCLEQLLFQRGKLHPKVLESLTDALQGDEHRATRELVSLLRSRSVLDGLQGVLKNILKAAR